MVQVDAVEGRFRKRYGDERVTHVHKVRCPLAREINLRSHPRLLPRDNMPTLTQATQQRDMGDFVKVSTPAAQQTPAPPNSYSMPGFDSLSLAPAPDVFGTNVDQQRQFYRPGVSQYRTPPLPTKANPQINASSRTIATQ